MYDPSGLSKTIPNRTTSLTTLIYVTNVESRFEYLTPEMDTIVEEHFIFCTVVTDVFSTFIHCCFLYYNVTH